MVGGRDVNGRLLCRHPRLFHAHSRLHLCLEAAGESKQWETGIGCSGTCQEWERDEKGREKWMSREEKWGSTPLNHGSSGRERCRGLEEDQMRLWEKVELTEISGNGQNRHFNFLPEGV